MAADVNNPRTWPLALQGHFWARTGPAAIIAKDDVDVPIAGQLIVWRNPSMQSYWAQQVGDRRYGNSPGDSPR